MIMQDRIHYDVQELIGRVERGLDDLKLFRYNASYRELLGDEFLKKLNDWDHNIRARKDDPFTVVVCGEFKRGKSSLINALLKEDVVTTNVTTETVTINRLVYGPHKNEAILSGGRRMTLSDEELKKENLEALIKNAEEPITTLVLHRPIEILKDITIVDTPGLNDALNDFMPLVEQALQQADAVIYVCSVEAPLSQSEMMFLKTLVLPQKYTDLFIIANYADIVREKDYDRTLSFLEQRVEGFLGKPEIIMLSALDELCRLQNLDRPNRQTQERLAESFEAFRGKLNDLLILKKDTILPDRIYRLTTGMLQDLGRDLDVIDEGLTLDARQAKDRSDAFSDAQIQRREQEKAYIQGIQNRIYGMRSDAASWIDALLDLMDKDLDSLAGMAAADIKKYYPNYCVDVIQEAVQRCRDCHMDRIYEEIESEEQGSLRDLKITNQQYGFRFALENHTWTKGDNIGYVGSLVSNFGLLSLIADGIGGAMREKEIKDQTPQLIEAIRKQFIPFRTSANDALKDIYESMWLNIEKQLSDYFNMHAQEAEQQNETLMRMAVQTEERKEAIRAAVSEVKQALTTLQSAVA